MHAQEVDTRVAHHVGDRHDLVRAVEARAIELALAQLPGSKAMTRAAFRTAPK